MATGQTAGLGTDGIVSRYSDSVRLHDVQRGWQSIAPAVATTTTITNLDDIPTSNFVVELPPDGQNIEFRAMGATTAGAIAYDLFLYPFDPGTRAASSDPTKNATNGNAAGYWVGGAAQAMTLSAKTATSPVNPASTYYVSDSVYIDRRGYHYLAAIPVAATTAVPASGIEGAYRVF